MFDQSEFEIRCEWGEKGVSQLSPISDVIIIVDVLSFSTSVEVATGRGARIYPYQACDDAARAFAESRNAELAGPRGESRYSLSPVSLLEIPAGTELVLPSLNGATLTLAAGEIPTFAGCLRNCRAVAEAAVRAGRMISVIPAGERWKDDGSIRFAIEDILGAGAIIDCLKGKRSPESEAAVAVFKHSLENRGFTFTNSVSGRELAVSGFGTSSMDPISTIFSKGDSLWALGIYFLTHKRGSPSAGI